MNNKDGIDMTVENPLDDDFDMIVENNPDNGRTIMLVDDNKDNLKVLATILENNGYETRCFLNALHALASAELSPPALLLLDINMPEMDGFEFCKVLKNSERLKQIPIIFISASHDPDDIIRAFYIGAIDYISKPFIGGEVLARVGSHLYNASLQLELQSTVEQLEVSLNRLKDTQNQLVQAEKLATVGTLVRGVAHEFNTPVGTAMLSSSTLAEHLGELNTSLENKKLTASQLRKFIDSSLQCSRLINNNLNRVSDLVKRFKEISVEADTDVSKTIKVKRALQDVLTGCVWLPKQSSYKVDIRCPEHIKIVGEQIKFAQIIDQLIENTVTHGYQAGEDILISIEVKEQGDDVFVIYADAGCGLATEQTSQIFEPFYSTLKHKKHSGLGLHIISNLVLQSFRGQINVLDSEKGLKFQITLPQEQALFNDNDW